MIYRQIITLNKQFFVIKQKRMFINKDDYLLYSLENFYEHLIIPSVSKHYVGNAANAFL